ncbi:MAG: hypothetical protein AB4368_23990 [Xenococcaceae cyanobacterium]
MPKRKKLDKNRLNKSKGLGAAPKSLPRGGKGSRVGTDWNIEWNRSTKIFYSSIIIIPYVAALVITGATGNWVMVGILLFVATLAGLVVLIVRKIDAGDDF